MLRPVYHVPHDAALIPDSVRSQFVLDDAALADEILRFTDHHTLALFTRDVSSDLVVRAPVSRLVVDVERFVDDAREPMAAQGMGVIYQRASGGAPLRRRVTGTERQQLIETWYRPHHALLTAVVEHSLSSSGSALIIDCHSFPSLPLPFEANQNVPRPEVCIGTDPYHTPSALVEHLLAIFRRRGFRVARDVPYTGAMVPQRYFRTEPRVCSVLIEINRSIYMDEFTGQRKPGFEATAAQVRHCITSAVERWQAEGGN